MFFQVKPLCPIFLFLFIPSAPCFKMPHLNLEARYPSGFRVFISDFRGIEEFGFNANINSPIEADTRGEISAKIRRKTGEFWVFQDERVELEPGDAVYYWTYVVMRGFVYRKTYQKWVCINFVKEFSNITLPQLSTTYPRIPTMFTPFMTKFPRVNNSTMFIRPSVPTMLFTTKRGFTSPTTPKRRPIQTTKLVQESTTPAMSTKGSGNDSTIAMSTTTLPPTTKRPNVGTMPTTPETVPTKRPTTKPLPTTKGHSTNVSVSVHSTSSTPTTSTPQSKPDYTTKASIGVTLALTNITVSSTTLLPETTTSLTSKGTHAPTTTAKTLTETTPGSTTVVTTTVQPVETTTLQQTTTMIPTTTVSSLPTTTFMTTLGLETTTLLPTTTMVPTTTGSPLINTTLVTTPAIETTTLLPTTTMVPTTTDSLSLNTTVVTTLGPATTTLQPTTVPSIDANITTTWSVFTTDVSGTSSPSLNETVTTTTMVESTTAFDGTTVAPYGSPVYWPSSRDDCLNVWAPSYRPNFSTLKLIKSVIVLECQAVTQKRRISKLKTDVINLNKFNEVVKSRLDRLEERVFNIG